MADLDMVGTWTCATNTFWQREVEGSSGTYTVSFERTALGASVQYDWKCSCDAFKYRPGYCKHIKAVMSERCGWNGELGPAAEALVKDGTHVCPHCEGPVIAMKVGV